ncbi:MAG: epoxyqueuosine reductase [Synergistales bacterium]|nr:epoxyqueuosine reductase [Synergistales bacterium]
MNIGDGLGQFIEQGLISMGASEVGFADLRPVRDNPNPEFKYAISIIIALDPAIVRDIAEKPTLAYRDEYVRVNNLLDSVALKTVDLLHERGHNATCILSTTRDYRPGKFLTASFSHKITATLSGLGWIGKNDLLVTPAYGSAVRLSTVFTDAPVPAGQPVTVSRCGACEDCVKSCPAAAPKGRLWQAGLEREEILDIRSCYLKAREVSSALGIDEILCGFCMTACPWTRRYIMNS